MAGMTVNLMGNQLKIISDGKAKTLTIDGVQRWSGNRCFLAGRWCLFYLPGPFGIKTDVTHDVMYQRTVFLFEEKLCGAMWLCQSLNTVHYPLGLGSASLYPGCIWQRQRKKPDNSCHQHFPAQPTKEATTQILNPLFQDHTLLAGMKVGAES